LIARVAFLFAGGTGVNELLSRFSFVVVNFQIFGESK
jgi:hypothetical protein